MATAGVAEGLATLVAVVVASSTDAVVVSGGVGAGVSASTRVCGVVKKVARVLLVASLVAFTLVLVAGIFWQHFTGTASVSSSGARCTRANNRRLANRNIFHQWRCRRALRSRQRRDTCPAGRCLAKQTRW